ncbi:MAG: SUMF1/EgtB/PvdO family nonheme iron enzyme [Anaerolineae bacterium]
MAGDFIMGEGKEKHSVNLAEFAISKYPITNAQFDAFVQDGGYGDQQWRNCWTKDGLRWKGGRTEPGKYGGVFDLPNHPVVGVTWYEAVAFCNWLGHKLGRPVSLPTEAQWERAARHTDGRRYPWGAEITPDHANYDATGIGTTTAVGIFSKGKSRVWRARPERQRVGMVQQCVPSLPLPR